MAKMKPAVLKALKGSIKKWQAIVEGTGADHGDTNCPLCKMFIDNNCKGCPVAKHTKQTNCEGSPYWEWCATGDGVFAVEDSQILAAVRELRFLQSLLPKGVR